VSSFARVRVEVTNADPNEPCEQDLLIEWPAGHDEPLHYTLSTLPAATPLDELVRVTKARWRTERAYEDLKGERGLDYFEGRTYVGWQYHVSTVLACYALVVACHSRAFPLGRPSQSPWSARERGLSSISPTRS
jgi:SRSO17 transposase